MSKGSTTTTGYYVEARCPDPPMAFHGPPKVGDQYIGHKWTRLEFGEGQYGVVKNDQFDRMAAHHHILTYAAAKAVMAVVAAGLSWRYSAEFRLVKVKCESSYTITEEGHSAPESFDWVAAREVEFTPVEAPALPTQGE